MGDFAYLTFAGALVAVPLVGMVAAWFFAMKRPEVKQWRAALFLVGMLLATYTVMAPIFVVLLAAFGIYTHPELRPASITALDRGLLLPGLAAFPLLVLGEGRARWFGIASSLVANVVAGFFILGATY
ncbi:MAG TPA: hypothetical protein VNX22_05575 [Acidobacteriaceae bacterium]|nr:hypothetical protein [Acidobacteriaceae bacterium]